MPCLPDRETTIEYLTEDTFREFLYQRTKVNNGVLQKFVEPKGIHNCTAAWPMVAVHVWVHG